jgi:hypothetical protein
VKLVSQNKRILGTVRSQACSLVFVNVVLTIWEDSFSGRSIFEWMNFIFGQNGILLNVQVILFSKDLNVGR